MNYERKEHKLTVITCPIVCTENVSTIIAIILQYLSDLVAIGAYNDVQNFHNRPPDILCAPIPIVLQENIESKLVNSDNVMIIDPDPAIPIWYQVQELQVVNVGRSVDRGRLRVQKLVNSNHINVV